MTPVESVRASSAEAFGFHGNLVEIDLREGPVLLTVHVDETEHARRTDARLGAITNRQLVTALWELPGGVELSTPDLPTWILDRLEDIPATAFDERRDALVRAARPPLRITGALAIGRRFDRILRRVGQVSALAPMAVVVPQAVDPTDAGLLDAQLYGVGVGSALGGVVTPVIGAAAVVPTLGPYLWWIAELAYERFVGGLQPRRAHALT